MQINLFITFNYAKLEKNPGSRRFKGISFRTDVYNDLSFVTAWLKALLLTFCNCNLIQINQPYVASFEFLLGTDKPECKRYKAIDDPTRYRAFKSGEVTNDYYLPEGWYAFIAGSRMSTSCCSKRGYCNTNYQGWLTVSHPTVDDGIVSRQVCFGDNYNLCYYSIYIKVRNCGSLYVYKLKPTGTSGYTRYCTQYR